LPPAWDKGGRYQPLVDRAYIEHEVLYRLPDRYLKRNSNQQQ